MVGMPSSIRKVFAVGDQTFDTYIEAQRYISSNRAFLQRNDLIKFLKDQISRRHYQQATDGDADPIADALLEFYEIKPRKTRNE